MQDVVTQVSCLKQKLQLFFVVVAMWDVYDDSFLMPCFCSASCSQQEAEVHQPGCAGGPECIAHPQHPLRPHAAGRALLQHVGRGHGRSAEGVHVSGHHPAAEEM